mmetsp:Transcript_38394/g.83887  ORF Transcript_38394/g.83887 Transcript_38394/m.83887 type:complete len:221 (-) Transcript_38394:193-855(-)
MCCIDKVLNLAPPMYPLDLHNIPGFEPVTCRGHSQRLSEDEHFGYSNSPTLRFRDGLTRCNTALIVLECISQQVGGAGTGYDGYSIFLGLPILANHSTGGLQCILALDSGLQRYNTISQITSCVCSVVRNLHTSHLDAGCRRPFRRCTHRMRLNVHWSELHVTWPRFGLGGRSFESALTTNQPTPTSNREGNKNNQTASDCPSGYCQHFRELRRQVSKPE